MQIMLENDDVSFSEVITAAFAFLNGPHGESLVKLNRASLKSLVFMIETMIQDGEKQ